MKSRNKNLVYTYLKGESSFPNLVCLLGIFSKDFKGAEIFGQMTWQFQVENRALSSTECGLQQD